MAIEIVADPHSPEELFLIQYKNSPKFKLFIQSFLQPIMVTLENEYQLFINNRSLQTAQGELLKAWMDLLATYVTYTDDEDLRRKLWIRVSELFSTGSIYDVRDFFQNYFKAFHVDIIELGNGQIDVDVYSGLVPPVGTNDYFKVFPAGLAIINEIRFLDENLVFSFSSDQRPFSLGFGIVSRIQTSYFTYVWPTDLSVSDRIRIQSVTTGTNLNVWIIFTTNNANAAALVGTLDDEVFDLYDWFGTQWSFRGTGNTVPGGSVTTVANGALTDVKVQLCYNNLPILKPAVNGIYVSYQSMISGGIGYPGFSSFTSSDQSRYNLKNPNGISLGFTETEQPNIGGRISVNI